MKKLVLIDGHSILNRAFYGIPVLTNSAGLHTNAVYGFLNILFKILDEEKADYLAVAFDLHAPTFRHIEYPEYKGTRKPMPEELREQVPLMKEVFSEIIHEIRIAGNSRRGRTFSIGLMDSHKRSVPSAHETLVLLDGVPVFNHDKLYNYDPLLVKYIDLYPYPYLVGTKFYDGVISFVTYKGNMPTMTFDGNVRIVGFKGASFPQAYTCSFLTPGDSYPDYRRTIYWNPLVEVPSGGSFGASVKLPDYKGDFTVVVEGFDSDGRPVCAKSSFSVR